MSIKYQAYLYWCAKQGLTALSFHAWKSVVRSGKLL
jgi:hypothetical protein